jgi:hypothetical protein
MPGMGSLLVDDYAGYKKQFAADALCVVTELGCWAHARRKFLDLQVNGSCGSPKTSRHTLCR